MAPKEVTIYSLITFIHPHLIVVPVTSSEELNSVIHEKVVSLKAYRLASYAPLVNGLQPFSAVDIAHTISKSIRTIAAFFLSTAALGDSTKPNIVFILADDLSLNHLSNSGGRARTPHYDRLARHALECGGRRSATPLLPHPI